MRVEMTGAGYDLTYPGSYWLGTSTKRKLLQRVREEKQGGLKFY